MVAVRLMQRAAELVVASALPAGCIRSSVLALTADTALLTAWANDVGFKYVFSRQVKHLLIRSCWESAQVGDHGTPIRSVQTARSTDSIAYCLVKEAMVVSYAAANVVVVLPAFDAPSVIQEVRLLVLHLLCELNSSSGKSREREGLFPTPIKTDS